jgi:octaprenyl-diphosphate synthase
VDEEIAKQLRKVYEGDAFSERLLHSFFRIGGKKLRPRLLLLSAFALRRDNLRRADCGPLHDLLVSLAAMVELIHSASLIHDDVLDDAETRRGQASMNARFGNKGAVLAGDILYSRAFEILVKATNDNIGIMLVQCVCRMCRAEVASMGGHDFETYFKIIEYKTAALMAFCCRAGVETVWSEGDSPATGKAIENFGFHFGMVYQLADDLSDGDSATVNANIEKTVALLQHRVALAEKALEQIPDSVYKNGLEQLLYYVTEKSKPSINSLHNQEKIEKNYAFA